MPLRFAPARGSSSIAMGAVTRGPAGAAGATGATGPAGSGAGDVTGPSSSVDSEIALFSSTTGKVVKRSTASGFVAAVSGVIQSGRTLTAPVAGLTISNPNGAAGNPTFALANDLAAYEGLSATGIVRRTGTDTASAGTLVTNAERANMAQSTISGRAAGVGTGVPTDLTSALATAILDNVTGDSGSGGVKGLVPAPAAGDAAASKFLKADGSWTTPTGSGDVTGPAASVDNEMPLFSGTGGKTLKRASTSGIACLSSGVMTVRTLTAPAAGITVSNGTGASGNPTLVLANDLAAYEGLATTGIVRRTGTDTASAGTLVTNAERADMAQATISGRASGAGTGAPTDLTGTQATVILDVFTGDAGAGGLKGLVKAPASGDALKFLRGDATWSSAGTGDLVASNNLSDVANAATAFGNIKQTGTSAATGALQLATTTEAAAMASTSKALTPEGLKYRTESFIIAASDETTALTAGTTKVTFRIPYAMTLTEIRASLSTAQSSGSVLTVDVNEAGTTIISTKLTFDNGQKSTGSAAQSGITITTAAVISDASIADNAEITVDIDQVGDGTAKGLKIVLIGRRT